MTDSHALALFRNSMASLASGVAVLTARHEDGRPCGLAATAVAAYSASPPSVLASVDHSSRCHPALVACQHFGLHILRTDNEPMAQVFAGKGEDKFAGLDWGWDLDVPRLSDTLAYLRLRRAEAFAYYDHTVVIGDVESGEMAGGEPLLYARRRMDWLLAEG